MNPQDRYQDGEIVPQLGMNLRWCASCGRLHGAAYICLAYSPQILDRIRAEEEAPVRLPHDVLGNGVSQLLAPFAARGRARRRA